MWCVHLGVYLSQIPVKLQDMKVQRTMHLLGGQRKP